MNLIDAMRNLHAKLDGAQHQDQLNVVCSSVLDGGISADLANKMAELLKVYSTNLEKGVVSDVKSEPEGGVL